MASLSGVFNVQQFADAGIPLALGRLYTYAPGTTTLKTAYTDSGATVPHTYTNDGSGGQYIALNGRGEIPAPLFLASGGYDLTLKRSDGSTVWSRRAVGTDDTANTLVASALSDFASTTDGAKGGALIGFSPTLNYTARTLARSLADREWNCRDFPWLAKFDGVTDDTAAILACLTALYAAGGGTMVMPRGTARISSLVFQWAAEKSIVIRGQGIDATILQKITGTTTPVVRLYSVTKPQEVHSTLRDFTIKGDGTKTHHGLQVESLAYLHTENLNIQSCDVGYECLGSLIATHKKPYWVDCNIGARTRKQGAVYANLLSFEGGEIGSNTTLGMDLGECSGIVVRDTELYGNGTVGNAATGAIRIRDTVDNETGFSRITLDNVWLESNKGRSFVVEDAGGLYLSTRSCNFTGGGADACYVGAIGGFVWDSCEAASPGLSDTLTVKAGRTVLIGGIVYQIADTSTYKTYVGFRTSAQLYDNYNERMVMGGNLYSTASLVYRILGGGPTYTNVSYNEGDHIVGFMDREGLGNPNAFLTTNGVPGNSTTCALRVGASRASGGTGRSINAGGTVNTLGADYAEYETKRSDCGELAKGAIVGFDAAGLLTDKWSLAKTFGIKSTSPSFVGGDTWAAGLLPDPTTGRLSPADEAELEARRQHVDRIAYSGKVPANIVANVGDYVIPQAGPGGSITAVGVASPSLAQYLSAIGQVRSIGADGRPVVAVKVS